MSWLLPAQQQDFLVQLVKLVTYGVLPSFLTVPVVSAEVAVISQARIHVPLTTSLPCCRPWNLSFSFGRALQVGQDLPDLLAAVISSVRPAACCLLPAVLASA